MIGLFATGINCLAPVKVKGLNLVPKPPDKINPFIVNTDYNSEIMIVKIAYLPDVEWFLYTRPELHAMVFVGAQKGIQNYWKQAERTAVWVPAGSIHRRSEERRIGKECRSRW